MEKAEARYARVAPTRVAMGSSTASLFRLGPHRFWYVQPDGALETWLLARLIWLRRHAYTDPRARVLQIQGPDVARDPFGGHWGVLDRAPSATSNASSLGSGPGCVRVAHPGRAGELWLRDLRPWDTADCDLLLEHHLLATGEPHSMIFGSLASMEIRRIEAGILDGSADFDLSMTPYEAGLGSVRRPREPGFRRSRSSAHGESAQAPVRTQEPRRRSHLPGSGESRPEYRAHR